MTGKHPIDWIIHALLCFIPIWQNWATWFVVAFVGILIEFEQWNYSGQKLTWTYFYYESLGDIIADFFGIIGGLLCKLI